MHLIYREREALLRYMDMEPLWSWLLICNKTMEVKRLLSPLSDSSKLGRKIHLIRSSLVPAKTALVPLSSLN